MSQDQPNGTIRSFEEARRQGAAARATQSKDSLIGWAVMFLGLIGLLATIWLITEVANGKASLYVWKVMEFDSSTGWGLSILRITAYLLSYSFIVGATFTVLHIYCTEYRGVEIHYSCNLFFSFWVLATVLLFALPLARSSQLFFSLLPSGLMGKATIILWGLGAFLVFVLVRPIWTQSPNK